MTRRRKAHRAGAAGRVLLSGRALLTATAMLLLVATVAISTTGGTYASLRSSRTIPLLASGATSTTISTGQAALTVNSDTISMTNLYPGDVRRTPITVTNTGVVALALSVGSITGPAAANGLTATVAAGACPGTGTPVSSGSLGVTLAAGGSTTVCLAIAMATTAPSAAQTLSTTVAVQVNGTQP